MTILARILISAALSLGLSNCALIAAGVIGAAVENDLGPPPPGGWCFDAYGHAVPCYYPARP